MPAKIKRLILDGSSLTLDQLVQAYPGHTKIILAKKCFPSIRRSQCVIQDVLKKGQPVYGVNTGFGRLKNVVISQKDLGSLQENLLRSHAVGMGDPLEPLLAWRLMLLRLNSLLSGYSGVRVELVQFLESLLNVPLIAYVPSQGSVGASGDLAPLAHMALLCLGEGEVIEKSQRLAASKALKKAKLKPLTLGPKEGLALINGTQMITTVLVEALKRLREAFVCANAIGALTLDVLLGTDRAFDSRLHRARGQKGQIKVSIELRNLLKGSQLRNSHLDCDRVQDPYSLRCMPQVHGAAWDLVAYAVGVVECELNAVTDNPLVLGQEVVSGGNFHGEPVALVADALKLAVAELASISERRVEQLVNPDLSGLEPFLVKEGGFNSGYMLAQVTAAALVSENKVLAHPASVDSIPTSANQEDHVSMGPIAARQLLQMVEHLESVLAIELLCACQALDFRRPLKTSPVLEKVFINFRKKVKKLTRDRQLSKDVDKAKEFLASGLISELTGSQSVF